MKKILFFVMICLFVGFSFAAERNLTGVKIISRQQWWADSKYLFSDYKAYKQIILNQQKYLNWLKKNKAAYQKYLEKKAKEKAQENYLLTNWKEQIRVDKKNDSVVVKEFTQ